MNKIIKNTLILAAITVVSGLVLGAAYEVTKGPIAQTQAKQKQEACQAVYPEADSFEAMDVDQKAAKEAIKKMGTNATVDEVYSAVMDGSEAGYVITVTDKDGYGGDIQITVGIMSDGTVNGISFLSISFTYSLHKILSDFPAKHKRDTRSFSKLRVSLLLFLYLIKGYFSLKY